MSELKAPNAPTSFNGKTWYMDPEDATLLVSSWKEYIKANKKVSLAQFVRTEIGKDIVLTQLPEDPSASPEGSQLRYIAACDTVYVPIDPCKTCHQRLLNYRQFLAEFVDLAGNVQGGGSGRDVGPNDDRPRFFFLLAPSPTCVC